MQDVALIWIAWELTQSSAAMAAMTLASRVPLWLFGLVGGICADGGSPRRIVLAANLIAAVAALAVPLLHSLSLMNVVLLGCAAFTIGIARAFEAPALYALIKALVEDSRSQALNGITDTSKRTARLVGPMLASAVKAVAPVMWCYAAVGAGFLLMAAAVTRFRLREIEDRPKRSSIVSDIRAAVRVVQSRQILLFIILMDVLFSLTYGACYWVFVPRLVIDILGGGTQGYAFVASAFAVGGLTGGFAGTAFRVGNKLWLAAGGLIVAGLTFGLIALLPNVSAVAAGAALIGASLSVQSISLQSVLHERCPTEHLGKLYSSWRFGNEIAGSLGVFAAGLIVDNWGVSGPMLAVAVYSQLVVLYCLLSALKAPLPATQAAP